MRSWNINSDPEKGRKAKLIYCRQKNLKLEKILTQEHMLAVFSVHYALWCCTIRKLLKMWLLFLPNSLHSVLATVGVCIFSQALGERYNESMKVLVAYNIFVNFGLVAHSNSQTNCRSIPFVSECGKGRIWNIESRNSSAFLKGTWGTQQDA